MIVKPAKRTESVKEYFFSVKNREIARLNAERAARGLDPVINLGIGSPDGMPPAEAIATLSGEAAKPGNHGYQSYMGTTAWNSIPMARFSRWSVRKRAFS